jgi:hypothetical protein
VTAVPLRDAARELGKSDIYSENLVENGFRISPECHVDIFPVTVFPIPSDGNALGWDHCSPPFGNPDYLGTVDLTRPRSILTTSSTVQLSFDSAGFPEIQVLYA